MSVYQSLSPSPDNFFTITMAAGPQEEPTGTRLVLAASEVRAVVLERFDAPQAVRQAASQQVPRPLVRPVHH